MGAVQSPMAIRGYWIWKRRLKPVFLSMVSLECKANIAWIGNKRRIKSRNMGFKAPLALNYLILGFRLWIGCGLVVNNLFREAIFGLGLVLSNLRLIRLLPTMTFQLSQLPMMVGSGRVHSTTRPFFCPLIFHFLL